MVVVAAVDLAGVAAGRGQFDSRRAAELAAPDHQRLVQQPALLQIGQQGGDRLVALPGQPAMVDFEVVVAVPGLALAVPELHEAHAPLDQPPGDQHLPGLHAGAVHVADVLAARGSMSKASAASICMR